MTNDQRTSAGIRPLFILSVVCIVAAAVLEFRGAETTIAWKDLHTAMAEADTTGMLMYVEVYADWDGSCNEMDRTTFTNDTVQTSLSSLYIPVRMNIDTDDFTDSLKNAWRIQGVPTSLILAPGGRQLRKQSGFMSATRMIAWLGDSSTAAFGSWLGFEDAREQSRQAVKPLLVVVSRNRERAEDVGKFFFEAGMRQYVSKTFVPTYVTADESPAFGNLQSFAEISTIPPRGMVLNVFTPDMRLLGQLVVTREETEDQPAIQRKLEAFLESNAAKR